MHTIEPFHGWRKYYVSEEDPNSPFYEKKYNYDQYSDTIYGYYIDPAWDFMGSETLYVKILYTNYSLGFAVIELLGEWNDAINNDIMHLKRNIIDYLLQDEIIHIVLIGENVLNFHGSDDSYYEEWYEDVESGWIIAAGFRDFIIDEWRKFNVDSYFHYGGPLELENWRTYNPKNLFDLIDSAVQRRLSL